MTQQIKFHIQSTGGKLLSVLYGVDLDLVPIVYLVIREKVKHHLRAA